MINVGCVDKPERRPGQSALSEGCWPLMSNQSTGDEPVMGESSSPQRRMFWLDLNDLVPQDHLLRKVNDAIDFSFIYDKVAHLYSKTGRPSLDPVIMFKMLLVGYLYRIPSERRL